MLHLLIGIWLINIAIVLPIVVVAKVIELL